MSRPQYMGLTVQRPSEVISYTVDTTNVAASPTLSTTIAKDITDLSSVTVRTTGVLSGSGSVSGNVITLPKLQSLTDGQKYRIIAQWTSAGNTYQDYFDVICASE